MNENTDSVVSEMPQQERKPYATPILADFGRIEEVTKGAINIGADAGLYEIFS